MTCNGKWGAPLCPNAFHALDNMWPVMRCKLTGKHPDDCAIAAAAREGGDVQQAPGEASQSVIAQPEQSS